MGHCCNCWQLQKGASWHVSADGRLKDVASHRGIWLVLTRKRCSKRGLEDQIAAMRTLLLVCSFAGAILCGTRSLAAQDIDSIVTSESRSPVTIASQIQNPGERSAYIELSKKTTPPRALELAKSFLQNYPQSAFLAPVYEVAARASFDLGDFKSGLEYAHLSLALLPENTLLLVAVADVQAHQHQNELAIASAHNALDYFDRFDRPAAIPKHDWSDLKRRQKATAWFVIGRALINQALQASDVEIKKSLLRQSAAALLQARVLNPDDMETLYLLGVAYVSAHDLSRAGLEFAAVYQHGQQFALQAREQLLAIYNAMPGPQTNFNDFVSDLESRSAAALKPPVVQPSIPATKLPDYAGSETCGICHVAIYNQWAQSGMSRMLRPYKPQNVIGDFQKNNEFYVGDDIAYRYGKLEITPHADRTLFARMVLRGGRHYFKIKQSDGRWHEYPVDYTIGSKWQQAYATTLPNGQIHVFPIQYSTIAKKWLNYWKVIDLPDTERSNPYNWEKLDISTNYKVNCAVCHTSQLRDTRGGGFDSDDLTFREPGVGCEMCHGPSAAHVAAKANDKPYKKLPLDPPVEFDRINNRQFVAICAQCHMQSSVHAGTPHGELNYSSTGTFFLKNLSVPFGEFARGAFYKDGRFKQTTFMVEALERSQCFRKGQVSCGTCHDPHSHDESSNRTALKFKDQPDLMCTGCHTEFQNPVQAAAHTHHPFDIEASRCVSCHMPRIMDGLLFRARSHQIDDIPNAQMTLRFGQQESPNACLLCHTDKSPQWLESQLQSWKLTP